jgi:hypothetical protein
VNDVILMNEIEQIRSRMTTMMIQLYLFYTPTMMFLLALAQPITLNMNDYSVAKLLRRILQSLIALNLMFEYDDEVDSSLITIY